MPNKSKRKKLRGEAMTSSPRNPAQDDLDGQAQRSSERMLQSGTAGSDEGIQASMAMMSSTNEIQSETDRSSESKTNSASHLASLKKMSKEDLWKLFQRLKEQNQRLKERNQRLKERNQRLKEKNQALNEECSIESLLEAMPCMSANGSCKPSIIDNDEAIEAVIEYREKLREYLPKLQAWNEDEMKDLDKKPSRPREPPFHYPALISSDTLQGIGDVQVNTKDDSGKLLESQLYLEADNSIVHKNGRRDMPHHNETSPQTYLSFGFKDVITCSGFRGIFEVVREATLFSIRPDLIVVLVDGRILLVVVVKNPGQIGKKDNPTNVFDSITAGGQILDYLKALKQQGIDYPFALLSTYTETVIATLPNETQKYSEILKKGIEKAKKLPSVRHEGIGIGKISPRAKPPTSPCRDDQEITTTQQQNHKDEDDVDNIGGGPWNSTNEQFDYAGREVVYSQRFDIDMLYKVMAVVLETNYESMANSRPLLPDEGTQMKGTELCTLYAHGFAYEKVKNLKFTYCKAPQFTRNLKYHVLCQIGQGSQGKTILCSTSTGKLFAAKLFLTKASTVYTQEERDEEEDSQIQENYDEALRERNLWVKLEPNYKSYCEVLYMNKVPALTMPFFPPVPFDKREKALSLIQKRLLQIAKTFGLHYDQKDLRWRHFGCRWSSANKMEITLLGLGSLTKDGQKKATADAMVAKAVQQLQERMSTDKNAGVKAVIV